MATLVRYLFFSCFTVALSDLGAILRMDSAVHTSGDPMSYCSECLEKFLPWTSFDRADFPSWSDDFHRDLYDLIECSNRCTLCEYICNLFGRSHLEGFIARAEEHNAKPEEPISDKVGHRSSFSLSSKSAPTLSIRYYTQNSRFDSNGNIDHVVAVILLQHHVAELWNDRRAFMMYTEAGMLYDP